MGKMEAKPEKEYKLNIERGRTLVTSVCEMGTYRRRVEREAGRGHKTWLVKGKRKIDLWASLPRVLLAVWGGALYEQVHSTDLPLLPVAIA